MNATANSTGGVLPYATVAELYAGDAYVAKNLGVFKQALDAAYDAKTFESPMEPITAFVPNDAVSNWSTWLPCSRICAAPLQIVPHMPS